MGARWILKSVLAGTMLAGVFVTAQGCAPSAAAYCDEVCDCQGCSQTGREDCITYIDESRKSAEDAGCGSEFNTTLACVSNGECVNDELSTAGCESEIEALAKCGAGTVGDACQAYANEVIAKYEACGITLSGGSTSGSTTCTDVQAKQATCLKACVSLIDCGCLNDPSGADCAAKQQPYIDCVTPCVQ